MKIPLSHSELHSSDVFDLPIQEKFEKGVAAEDTAAEPSLERELIDPEGQKAGLVVYLAIDLQECKRHTFVRMTTVWMFEEDRLSQDNLTYLQAYF